MAISATTEQDVQRQFLTESVVLSLLGGTIGVLVGVGASLIITKVLGWAVLVSPAAIAAAVVFSMGVGVFFGFLSGTKSGAPRPDRSAAV